MNRNVREPARFRHALLLVFVVALLLRLWHVSQLEATEFSEFKLGDAEVYDAWAHEIADGNWLGTEVFYQAPLYPYLLGMIYATLGHDLVAVVAVQSLLGALVVPLVFFSARPWFDMPTSTTAGAIAAVYLPAVYFGGLIMKPGLALFLVAVWLWLLSRGMCAERGWPTWLAAGGVFGLACLTRGNLVLVAPLVALWLLCRNAARPGLRQ